jgi:hypothetical protein
MTVRIMTLCLNNENVTLSIIIIYNCIMTLNLVTLSITTPSIVILHIATLSIVTLRNATNR